jgi:hypothetical protein
MKAVFLTPAFTGTTAAIPARAKLALPVQPATAKNGMRAAVSIDGGPLTVLDFFAAEFSKSWHQHVLTNSAVAVVHGLKLKPRAYSPIPETRLERTAP